jgi:hypothetical protein
MSRTVAGGLLAVVLLVLPAVPLAADEKPCPPEKKVRVCVVVILGTERDAQVDRRLKDLAAEVKKFHPRLTGFHIKNLGSKSLAVGARDTFKLIGGQVAGITVQKQAGKDNRVQLKVTPPMMGEITYSTPCGKFLPIVTPYRTRNNDLLIIAIRVQPCHRGK